MHVYLKLRVRTEGYGEKKHFKHPQEKYFHAQPVLGCVDTFLTSSWILLDCRHVGAGKTTADRLGWWKDTLKGLSREIFGPVFWPVWMHHGLNRNRFWFLRFKEAPPLWDRHCKLWCVSCRTFSEILRISEKDWQLNPRFSEIYINCKLLWDMLMLLKNFLGELRTQLQIFLWELGTRLPILLGDSTNLQEIFIP
jgi:hypothetical protein